LLAFCLISSAIFLLDYVLFRYLFRLPAVCAFIIFFFNSTKKNYVNFKYCISVSNFYQCKQPRHNCVYNNNNKKIKTKKIEGRTNFRIHHFLSECIAFGQSTLRQFLPECITRRTTRGSHTSSFFA